MTDHEHDIRRAHEALTRAVAAQDADFEHPGGAMLEALVDGRLDAADREIVETHLLDCRPCGEDVADLRAMREELTAAAPVPATDAGSRRRSNALIYGGVAAAILLVVLLRALPPASQPAGEPGTATSAAPPQSATATPAPAPPLSALTAAEQVIVRNAITSGRLEVAPETRALAGQVGTLLSGAEAQQPTFGPLTPMGSAVLSASPSFEWHPHPNASAYTVSVFNTDFREIVRSPRLSAGTTWTPGSDLRRGRTYLWQIRAHLTSGEDVTAPAPPNPEARFHIVDERVLQEITELRKRLADRPLQLGILLARSGLLIDAARELERASKRAEDAETARALLADLRARP